MLTYAQVTAFSLGEARTRGLQEYTIQPYTLVGKVPDNVSLEDAATIPDNFVTAFFTLFSESGLEWPHPVPGSAGASIQLTCRDAGLTKQH